MSVLIMPTGPADELETALLMFVHIINSARERIWISSPYFVPDEAIMSALTLARLRGLDVRIIIPEMPEMARQVLAERKELSSVERLLIHTALLFGQSFTAKQYRDDSP